MAVVTTQKDFERRVLAMETCKAIINHPDYPGDAGEWSGFITEQVEKALKRWELRT